jgi:cysteine desulfurase
MTVLRQSGPVYLDFAATTPLDPLAAKAMIDCLQSEDEFGNAASETHAFGEAARERIEAARNAMAGAVGAGDAQIVFTSGATEANNLAIAGVARYYARKRRHLVTARTEHKSVLDPCRALAAEGWSLTELVPDRRGLIEPATVEAALRPDTVLVSIMQVNNEIGTVQHVGAIAAICARHGVFLHVDAAQSMGKLPLDVHATGADLISLSAHKAYGPKGIGALVVSRKRGVQLEPLLRGGGQEGGLRSGTLPTHQILGMAAAFTHARELQAPEATRIAVLRDRLWHGLERCGGILRNGAPEHCVPHILNVSVEGVSGESLIAEVSDRIAVSTGSACASATADPSYVLRALGRSELLAEASLRISLGRSTTHADVDVAIDAVTSAVRRLRRVADHAL